MSDKDIKKYLDSIYFPKYMDLQQSLTVFWWSLFNRKRLVEFCIGISKGKSVHFAFQDAKNKIYE
jgi:hypothetical protein